MEAISGMVGYRLVFFWVWIYMVSFGVMRWVGLCVVDRLGFFELFGGLGF